MKILTTILIIFCLFLVVVGVIAIYTQHEEKQQQIAERKRIEEQQQLAAEKRHRELKKCEEVLNWFREQEYCTVEPLRYGDRKTSGYRISWRINTVRPDTGSKTRNREQIWISRSGTYEQLIGIKKQFERDKSLLGLN